MKLTATANMDSMDLTDMASYKKKVDQLTVLVKHYQTELETQKVRRDGVETVSRLLAESRQEILQLRQSKMAMQTMIKNLQNRVTSSGLTLTSGIEEDEVIVPGTSKQTLTNLAIENKRLRSMLDSQSKKEEGTVKQSKEADSDETFQQALEKMETENKSMKKKLMDLETLFKSSNNDKDRQLIEYHEELQRLRTQEKGSSKGEGEKDKSAGRKDSVSSNVGAPVLKEQLLAFIGQCQEFATQLEQADISTSAAKKEKNGVRLIEVAKQAVERTDSVDAVDVQQLLEEKQKLQDRVEDVTRMNQRWQEFYSDREEYYKQMEEKVHVLEKRLKEAMRSGPTEEINRRIEQVLESSQKEREQLEEARRKAEDDVQRLEGELLRRDNQIAQLQSQLTILSRTQPHQMAADVSSTIEHLKAQIQVCTEDFEKERQDRQVALQKVASLQEQNTIMQKKVLHFQKLNTHLQTLVCNQMGPGTKPTAQEHSQQPNQDFSSLQPRGGIKFAPPSLDCDISRSQRTRKAPPSLDFTDFPFEHMQEIRIAPAQRHVTPPEDLVARGIKHTHSQSDSALATEPFPSGKQENYLTCPKCNKEFSEERQGDLLAHMDMCWE